MYSNCLFEALKAKIKDPKNVQIHKIPSKLNDTGKIFPHFWWSVADVGFDFKKESKTRQVVLFDGKIRSFPKTVYEEHLSDLYKKYSKRQAKKLGIQDPFIKLEWHYGEINIDAEAYYLLFDDNESAKVRIVRKEKISTYHFDYWRPVTEEFSDVIINGTGRNEDGLVL